MRSSRFLPLVSGLALLLGGVGQAQTTQLLSRGVGGGQLNSDSGAWYDFYTGDIVYAGYSISSDGRFVAYASNASNVVPGDSNGTTDIFRYDRQTGSTVLVSVGVGGAVANGQNGSVSISADGRFVAFASAASNLVTGDTNGQVDVFVHDCQTGSTVLASVDSGGVQSNGYSGEVAISGDGHRVAFMSYGSNLVPGDTNGLPDVFVRDLQANTTTRVSVSSSGAQANGQSPFWPTLSADGRYVVFDSDASNLVAGDTNNTWDVFVHDMQTGSTIRASVDGSGVQGNGDSDGSTISPDGRYVAFGSASTNLVPGGTNGMFQIFLHDLQGGSTILVSTDSGGIQGNDGSGFPSISADDSYVAFTSWASNLTYGDYNHKADVFLRDVQNAQTYCVSVTGSGGTGNSDSVLNPGGVAFGSNDRYVCFMSAASNLVSGDTNGSFDLFFVDEQNGTTSRVSLQGAGLPGNQSSSYPFITPDGRYVGFASDASDLIGGDTNHSLDAFVLDRQAGTLVRASVDSSGTQGNGESDFAAISDNGRYVVFDTQATNLFPNDQNGTWDIVLKDLVTGTITNANVGSNGSQGNSVGGGGAVSSDGRYVAFWSFSTLVSGDTNNAADVFLRDVQSATTTRLSVATNGVQGNGSSFSPAMTPDGRFVVFESDANNLVPGDDNGVSDVFVRDVQNGTTRMASVDSNGVLGNANSVEAAISGDGRYVAFLSLASNLVPGDTNGTWDVFVRDMTTGTTTRVNVASNGTQADGPSDYVRISSNGRFVTFDSDATNLVPADTNGMTDFFLHDRLTGITERASVDSGGVQGNQPSYHGGISTDGRFVAFDSYASNLIPGDSGPYDDVFLRDRGVAASMWSFCFGDGTGTPCPCGNSGSPGRGCQNSAGTGGAMLTGTGTPSLAADTVYFTSTGELPTSTSVLLSGPTPVNSVNYGDGLRCAGGSLKRLYLHSAAGGTVTMPQGADLSVSARSAASGDPLSVGSTRIYQIYYRDSSATFCPPPAGASFNISNALAVVWGP